MQGCISPIYLYLNAHTGNGYPKTGHIGGRDTFVDLFPVGQAREVIQVA